jgi:4-hydroxy-tetrahydrodipicolinate reductase
VTDAGADVAVELSVPAAAREHVDFLVDAGVHAVVGTTGWDAEALDALRTRLGSRPGVGVLVAPNFAVGAVLAMRFAAAAAPGHQLEVLGRLDGRAGRAAHPPPGSDHCHTRRHGGHPSCAAASASVQAVTTAAWAAS